MDGGGFTVDIMARLRGFIVQAVTTIVVLSTVASTIESYMGLRAWAAEHAIVGLGADIFPLFIDSFPLAAEGVLIVAYIDRWKGRARVLPWVVLTFGLAVSVALNVGQIHSTDEYTLGTHGTFPLATWLSLLVGTAMFKRIMANKPKPVTELDETDDEMEYVVVPAIGPDLKAAEAAFDEHIKVGRVPGLNLIRREVHVGPAKATIIKAHLSKLAAQYVS